MGLLEMSSAKLCVINDYLQNKELTLSHVIYLYVISSRAKKSLLVGIGSPISMYLHHKQKGVGNSYSVISRI